jgi:hypothetical protein
MADQSASSKISGPRPDLHRNGLDVVVSHGDRVTPTARRIREISLRMWTRSFVSRLESGSPMRKPAALVRSLYPSRRAVAEKGVDAREHIWGSPMANRQGEDRSRLSNFGEFLDALRRIDADRHQVLELSQWGIPTKS